MGEEQKVVEEKDVEVVETPDNNDQAEEKLQDATEKRLEKVFVENEPLDSSAEPEKDSDDSTPDEKDSADDSDDDDGPTPDEAKEEAKDEAKEKTETKSNEEKGVEEKAKDVDAGKGDEKKDVPQLSDAYYRAAIHRGWTDDDIKEMYDANPELTIRTLGKVYEALNRSSKEFAAVGRSRKQDVKSTKTQQTDKVVDETAPKFKGVDMAKLRKDYPDDPIVELVETQNEIAKQQFEQIQNLERSAPKVDQPSSTDFGQVPPVGSDAAMAIQQIDTFFNNDELKGYADFYGVLPKNATDWNTLTPGQKMNRWTVVEMMDEMITGASVLGRKMEIDEGMRLAHLSVSEPIREKVIREDILSKVVKRSSSLSLKPANTAKQESTKPETEADLQTVTAERLAKVFS